MTNRAVVVGAGVIGQFSAWTLARAGWDVTVFERGADAREASWAGGGILMSLEPWEHPRALDRLLRASRQAYPEIAAQLSRTTGIDPEYLVSGALVVGPDRNKVARWARDNGEPVEDLDAGAVGALEPAIRAPDGAARLAEVAQVRNPRLLQALTAHLLQLGVSFRFNAPVAALERDDAGAVSVRTATGSLAADAVIVAGGAWSAALLAPLGITLPVEPVKGQMLLLRPGRPLLRHVVLGEGAYVVPRKDGHVLVGSTLERAGFDKTPTPEAADQLRRAALARVPALAEARVERHWAGLRPGSTDELPFIGRVPGGGNLFVNTGHFRLGLTLAPASGALLGDLVLERAPEVDPAPFRPDRPLTPPAARRS